MASVKQRGPSGLQPKPKGRPVTTLSGAKSTQASIYYIAYRHKAWDRVGTPPLPESDLLWEFYYSAATFERAKERLLAEKHPKMYTGQFQLGTLLHPTRASLFIDGVT